MGCRPFTERIPAMSKPLTRLFQAQGLDYTTSVFVKSVPQDLKDVDLESYDLVVFYNPADLKSLYANFPEFKPGNARFVTFGKQIVKAKIMPSIC